MTTATDQPQTTEAVFQQLRESLNEKWTVTLRVNKRLVGGIPAVNFDQQTGEVDSEKSIDLLTVWLRKALADKMSEEEIAALAAQTFEQAFKEGEAEKSTTFKTDEVGLYIEGRCVKAMLKEAGGRLGMGKAVKGERPSLRQDLHEALHVDEDAIHLMRDGQPITEPDGCEAKPIQVMTAQGPRSSIKRTAYVDNPTITFTMRILKNVGVKEEHLMAMLAFGQDLGLGADRSQSNGKFTVVGFERISAAE